jgi:hypothetical protein
LEGDDNIGAQRQQANVRKGAASVDDFSIKVCIFFRLIGIELTRM